MTGWVSYWKSKRWTTGSSYDTQDTVMVWMPLIKSSHVSKGNCLGKWTERHIMNTISGHSIVWSNPYSIAILRQLFMYIFTHCIKNICMRWFIIYSRHWKRWGVYFSKVRCSSTRLPTFPLHRPLHSTYLRKNGRLIKVSGCARTCYWNTILSLKCCCRCARYRDWLPFTTDIWCLIIRLPENLTTKNVTDALEKTLSMNNVYEQKQQ